MANLINAKTSGAGGLETTADNTGNNFSRRCGNRITHTKRRSVFNPAYL
jgi:hypothetical protein